ncbi:spermine oxidase-like [Penaeus chinensis]|uniref:spermine oxidase-like n=1 Tax=Penaeus chinensis TaxID=139456 RepID=UPI001FB6060A|nr:spermine oxidase-like [Penaeus chinensis]
MYAAPIIASSISPQSSGGETFYYSPWIKQSPRPETHPCDDLRGEREAWYAQAERVGVVIVGGGLAGLSAAKTLADNGFSDYVLLEAQEHLGGRVYTVREGSITVEEGAEWIHGGWRNPLYRIAREIEAVDPLLPDDAFEWRIVTQDGAPVNKSYGDLLEELRDVCERSDFGLLPYYDLPYGLCYLNRFSQEYAPVKDAGIRRGLLHFLEQVLELPFCKGGYVDLGIADKVQLGWATPWWGDRPLTLDIIWTSKDIPQDRLWLYNIVNIESPHSAPNVLQVFLVGRDSVTMENLPEETVLEHMMYFLKRLTRAEVPDPIFFHRTTWYNNPWTRGAYETYISLWGEQQGMESHDPLAIPVANSNGVEVVAWAGEHTHSTRFGTADGAMATGEREGYRILDLLEEQRL